MKIPLRLSMLGAVTVGVLSVVTLTPAMADTTLTSDQQQSIVANCSLIKNTLNQLHVSDALLRVNRGQFYESMASKLMERFNTRLANNSINNNAFVSVTNDYNATLDSFRSDYQSYEEQLSAAIAVDCSAHPVLFSQDVSDARTKRIQVHADVIKLNQDITNYQIALTDFSNSYQQAVGAVQ